MNKISNIAKLKELSRSFASDRQGVTAIEYGLIAGIIAVGIVVTLNALSGNLIGLFTTIFNTVGGA